MTVHTNDTLYGVWRTLWNQSPDDLYPYAELEGYEMTEQEVADFNDLFSQKIRIVEERNELVMQREKERLR